MKKIYGPMIGILGAILAVIGMIGKEKEQMSVAIIGGADGPTSIFLAGKVGGGISSVFVTVGVLLLVMAILWYVKQRR